MRSSFIPVVTVFSLFFSLSLSLASVNAEEVSKLRGRTLKGTTKGLKKGGEKSRQGKEKDSRQIVEEAGKVGKVAGKVAGTVAEKAGKDSKTVADKVGKVASGEKVRSGLNGKGEKTRGSSIGKDSGAKRGGKSKGFQINRGANNGEAGTDRGFSFAAQAVVEELYPCEPFQSITSQRSAQHMLVDSICSSNACSGGCCRNYNWLVCDDQNQLPFMKCICNSNTNNMHISIVDGTVATGTSVNVTAGQNLGALAGRPTFGQNMGALVGQSQNMGTLVGQMQPPP